MGQQISNEYPWKPQLLDNCGEGATVDLLEVLCLFWRHLRKIVLWLIIGGAAGALYTLGTCFQAELQYKATTQVYITPAENNASDVITILSNLSNDDILISDVASAIKSWQRLPSDESIIADYEALLVSRPLLQDVIENLSLDMDPATLGNMITVSNLEDTHIIDIAVIGSNAQQVSDIANELVFQGEIYFRNFVGLEPPKLLERSEVSASQFATSGSEYFKNAAVGGLLTTIIYCAFLLIKFLMDKTIVGPEDVLECFGVKPLATIPTSNQMCIQQHNTGEVCKREKGKIK